MLKNTRWSQITGDGDAHNPVSSQVSVKAEDEPSKYVVARCCARIQIVLSLKSKTPPTKQISYKETVLCIVMLLQLKHPALLKKWVENDRCHKTITIIYLYKHSSNQRQVEEKPNKETLEILHSQPTKTAGQMQLDFICEALFCDKCGNEVNNVALS